jgi:hypothetical protein
MTTVTQARTDSAGARRSGIAALVSRLRERLLRALPLPIRRRWWFWEAYRRRLPLRHPVTFAEKMNWRIVYDRRELLAVTCDKVVSQEFALARCEGLGLRVPATYWSGTDLAELATVDLPDEWVLKPNHRSGLVIFGNSTPDIAALRRDTEGWLDEWQWSMWGEWAYCFARRAIVAEERIGGSAGIPPDYKVYVYDGVPRFVQVIEGRLTTTTQRFYTEDWEPLEWESNSRLGPVRPRPPELSRLLEVAGRIGAGFDFMRVDLYLCDGEVWFGELTAYSHGGYRASRTPGVEETLGAAWTLPVLSATNQASN